MRTLVALIVVVAGFAANAEDNAKASFHHVRLNVTHPEKTIEFYESFLSAVKVRYRDVSDAVFTERSFILFNKVGESPPSAFTSALWHIGWGGIDGENEYKWLKEQGALFSVELTPLGDSHYMYLIGPDAEAVEIFTGPRHHRFNHIHLFATDVNTTTQWFIDHLGLEARRREVPKPPADAERRLWSNAVTCDNVGIIIFGRPHPDEVTTWWPAGQMGSEFEPTDGRAINHFAFSYRDIEPEFERMKAAGVEIVRPIQVDENVGHKSFFVRAPDKVLVEIVQARPIPDAAWD